MFACWGRTITFIISRYWSAVVMKDTKFVCFTLGCCLKAGSKELFDHLSVIFNSYVFIDKEPPNLLKVVFLRLSDLSPLVLLYLLVFHVVKSLPF